jgi:hypothetical protein
VLPVEDRQPGPQSFSFGDCPAFDPLNGKTPRGGRPSGGSDRCYLTTCSSIDSIYQFRSGFKVATRIRNVCSRPCA